MKIVITGATGNLGTALLRRLVADHHELVGLARRLPEPDERDSRVQWSMVDLTHEEADGTLRRAFRGADAVVHLAWGFQPSHDPDYLGRLGVGGTRRVLAAATAEQVPHLVHLSSVGAYSPKLDDRPVDETWPTDGVPGSTYSAHKVAAERLLDDHESTSASSTGITRLRPGIVGQRAAASALLRYGVPGFIPARAIRFVPVLPLDRAMTIPVVHADDVASAVQQVVSRRALGAFNLAATEPVGPQHIAEVFGARTVHVPNRILRAATAATWRTRLQKLDPGWLDLAMAVPVMDTSRARAELGWVPMFDAKAVLRETLEGLQEAASAPTPALRPRSVLGQLGDLARHGPISRRRRT